MEQGPNRDTQATAERKRTFTGCKTCRKRHIKCDSVRPHCNPCRQAGLACGGYWSPLLWLTEGVTSRAKPEQRFEFRYPVLSEAQRQGMSNDISKSLGRRSVANLISRLDTASCILERRDGTVSDIFRGPFGVFLAQEVETSYSQSPSEVTDPVSVDPQPERYQECDASNETMQWLNWTTDCEQPSSDNVLPFLSTEIDLDQWMSGSSGPEPTFEPFVAEPLLDPMISEDLPELDNEFLSCVTNNDVAIAGDSAGDSGHPVSRNETSSYSIVAPDLTPADKSVLPIHTDALLRHYRQEIYEVNCNQTKRELPWQTVFFPCALETFAELSLWRNTSNTRFALLYGILALSAFVLHAKGNSQEVLWYPIGLQYQKKAQSHLRAALKAEVAETGQTHKELLMAILVISSISLSRGGGSLQIFLLDAERLIRRQGLVDAIPKDFRVLNHMYSFMRVLSESTGAYLEAPTDDPRGHNEPPEKGGKFCLAEECYHVGLDPEEEKTLEIGYTDIHLQVQGQWKKSLYPTIYGFPESLWTLLSQTVATANEKARVESLDPPNPMLTASLKNHIENLEATIWAWTPTSDLIGPQKPDHLRSPQDEDLLDNPLAKSLVQSLHNALVLYFYRRVLNLSPMILQDAVSRAFDHVELCMSRVHDQDLTVCIAWATFTAACEANTPSLRERALRLLATTDEQGIFLMSRPSTEVVAMVWEQRKTLGDQRISWGAFGHNSNPSGVNN